jgi:NADH:ubiquinone oxidoreductase subunit E
MELPISQVNGVVTFYSFFSMEPKGKYVISVCLGTACYVRGGSKVLDTLKELLGIDVAQTTKDQKFTLEVVRCIGSCGLAPAMTINGKVFKRVNPKQLGDLLSRYE